MSLPTLTTVVTARTTTSPRRGSLSLCSPVSSPTQGRHKHASSLSNEALTLDQDNHAFRPPSPTASRSPFPALNTLANHGYLPRDGHNITSDKLIAALRNPDTYHLSYWLAEFLARGGLLLLGKEQPISLHDLAEHNRIEHSASIVHKDTAPGERFAPIRTDITLLDEFLEGKDSITLDDVANRRVMLERVSKIDPVHGEIARGEWALVLDVFEKAHGGGYVPVDSIERWLKENRFPEGWKPTHEQGLDDTIKKSKEIRKKMKEYEKVPETIEDKIEDEILAPELHTTA